MNTFIKYYWPAVLWAIFIFVMCSIKMGDVGHSPLFFPGFDKLVHTGFFFVLVILYGTGSIRQQSPPFISYKSIVIITIISVLYGGLIEILQLTIFTWRSGEWNDFFADIVGASMAAFSLMLTVNAMGYEKK